MAFCETIHDVETIHGLCLLLTALKMSDAQKTVNCSFRGITRISVKISSCCIRVATVREKSLDNEFFSRSGKSQGISILVGEI